MGMKATPLAVEVVFGKPGELAGRAGQKGRATARVAGDHAPTKGTASHASSMAMAMTRPSSIKKNQRSWSHSR
jgi:hypothetical protein